MSSIARRAVLVSVARLCNQAIAVFSPILLVRLLPVAEFGEYRRFYLYFNILSVLALMGINASLMYFVPRQPAATWTIVRRCASLVAVSSVLAVTLVFVLDQVSGGRVVGQHLMGLLIYTLLFVNLDFWEALALARKQPLAVLGYSVGRLIARMTTAVVTAALTADVDAIITALIVVEIVRVAIVGIVWWRLSRRPEQQSRSEAPSYSEILQHAVPLGCSVLVLTASQQVGGIIVDRFLGATALAYFAIGGYVYLIVTILRNSISDVLLPEMSAAARDRDGNYLALWRRSTIVFAILLLPAAVLLAWFAEPVVTIIFSSEYLPAVPVFQIYLLLLVREFFDFDLALRASGRTSLALRAHVMTLILNVSLALVLVPSIGITGAALSIVVSRGLAAIYLAVQVARVAEVPTRQLIPWADLLKVIAAGVLAGLILWPARTFDEYGWVTVILASLMFGVIFMILLRCFGIAEARWVSALISRRFGWQHS